MSLSHLPVGADEVGLSTRPGILEREPLRTLLNLGPFALAGGAFATVWNYLPEATFTEPYSKYAVTLSIAIAVGFLALFLRFLIKSSVEPTLVLEPWAPPFPPFQQVSEQMVANLRDESTSGEYGFCHYFLPHPDAQAPSALSTAYGLRILILLGLEVPGIDIDKCTAWVQGKANQDGGWHAQSQGTVSRSEVTATIAGTLARLKGRAAVSPAADLIATITAGTVDSALRSSTYVVSNILEESFSIGLSTASVDTLTQALLNGAVSGESGYHWTDRLDNAAQARPSAPMTARAVLALQALKRGGYPLSTLAIAILDGGVEWLGKNLDLANQTSQVIRYPSTGHQEVNVPRHFTSALVAIALMQAGLRRDGSTERALKFMMSSFDGGLWWWDNGEAPMWMTYLGLAALVSWHLGGDESG